MQLYVQERVLNNFSFRRQFERQKQPKPTQNNLNKRKRELMKIRKAPVLPRASLKFIKFQKQL